MFIIAGPPGAGKTTQSKMLADELGFIWVSAGQLVRENATGENREAMLEGELVDNDYVDSLVEKELDKHQGEQSSRVILDGYPRDFPQARWLIDEYGATINAFIIITISEEVAIQRLLARGRVDDTPETITERMEVFHEETEGISEYFAELHVPIITIDGSREPMQVQADIRESIGAVRE